MSQKRAEAHQVDESQRELEELELRTRMERVGQKIIVLSGKGGVGKSTIAANLAIALAMAGRKVGLLDVDLHGPSVPKILGLEGKLLGPDCSGGIEPVALTENLKVVSIGLLPGSGHEAVIWRGPMKHNVICQLLRDVAWGELDYLVIDSPPGTGDEPLTVAQSVGRGALAVIVTTPQDVAIADVRRCVSFCNRLSLRVLGIVENMSGLLCPHCGKQVYLFKTGGGEKLAAEVGAPFLGRVPLDPQIVASGDDGTPFVQAFADSRAAEAFAGILEAILKHTTEDESIHPVHRRKENARMKIAIPTANGKLCMHFGHCEQFALVEVDEAGKAIIGTDYLKPPPHEPGVLPRWLHEQGAEVIIAGGMGQRAQGLFSQNGIKVLVGAPPGTAEEIVSAFLNKTLQVGDNVCDH